MEQVTKYIPHIHVLFLISIAILVVWKLNTFLRFSKEVLSEQNLDGSIGKGSSKRVIIMFFATTWVYQIVYSLHTGVMLDKYVITLNVVFLMIALKILAPEQVNTLLDKLKQFTTFKSETPQELPPKPDPTIRTTTTTEVTPANP